MIIFFLHQFLRKSSEKICKFIENLLAHLRNKMSINFLVIFEFKNAKYLFNNENSVDYSHSLSLDITSCSLQAKFLAVGCVSKRPVPIAFIVWSAGLICFFDPEFKKFWCFSRKYRISLNFENKNRKSLTFKNDDTESFLFITVKNDRRKSHRKIRCFWLEKNDDADDFLCLKTKNF